MTSILLSAAFFLCGLAWGVTLTFRFAVLPLREKLVKHNDMMLKFLDDQLEHLTNLMEIVPTKKADGSMLSPIQMPPKE